MNYTAMLAAIRDADFGESGLDCWRLFTVEPTFFAALVDETRLLCARHHGSDATRPGHVTAWTKPYGRVEQLSLLNRSGRLDDTSSDHDLSCLGKRFRYAERYPVLARFIALFPHCVNFRLNSLGPGAGLPLHKEYVTQPMRGGGVGIKARFHLPLVTNAACEVILGRSVYHLAEGIVYFFNNGCIHGARNGGSAVRLHLVWDMLLTREACATMFGSRPFSGPLYRIRAAERRPSPRGEVATEGAVLGGRRPVTQAKARAVTFFHPQ